MKTPPPVLLLLLLGLVLGSALPSRGGDILRGGAAANETPNGLRPQGNTAGQVQARSNARDAMARTAQAITAVQAMQLAARQAAQQTGKNLGTDPNHAGKPLPDGLVPGGLQVAPGATPGTALWSGAGAPVPSFAGNGRVNVKIKQTQSQALLNWQTFNVGAKTTLTYDQSSGGANASKWIAFNKVNDPTGNPSQIMGSIQAQGQVYIINGNGIIFGSSSQVNAHTLVASALPINDNLIKSGLLNNPDTQFLFSGLQVPAGASGTPAFTPAASNLPGGRWGDVTVQAGAQIVSPASASKVGGRVALIGANVSNAGTISTPDGQTILAGGLQVGMAAHVSTDPSLRGLDVYVGAVADPASTLSPYAGGVTNSGMIEAPGGNIFLTGKTITHTGVIKSSTSVALNGRVDINASYDAAPNTAYKPGERPGDLPFLFRKTGNVELGAGSVIQILPEYSDTSTVAGTELALKSQVNIRGLTAHMGTGAIILAPSGTVNVNTGTWDLVQTANAGTNRFVRSAGQIYLDRGAQINVAGTTDATANLLDYLLTLQLRAGELAGSPLQRESIFRNTLGTGASITVDLRRTGFFNGSLWVGTPLADLSGYLSLIQRTISELTTAGGTVNLSAGSSVVMQPGSKVDVSAGWVNYSGGQVQTTRVVVGGHLLDIADATPNQVYAGIYTGEFNEVHSRWGVTKNFIAPWMTASHYEQPYFDGAAGGGVQIAAAGVALDGSFAGNTVAGPRQLRGSSEATSSSLPKSAQFSLSLTSEQFLTGVYPEISPTPGNVTFQTNNSQAPAAAFTLDANGQPAALRADRLANIYLSPGLLTRDGFGSLNVYNPDGRITVPAGVTLETVALGSVKLAGANVDVLGGIRSPGGTVEVTAYNISPAIANAVKREDNKVSPPANTDRGFVTLGTGASISTAGLVLDDRLSAENAFSQPLVTTGGTVAITAFSANLAAGSLVDVSGGARMSATGSTSYGDAGGISIKTGQDVTLADVTGGTIRLDGSLLGRSGANGGALSLQALLLQVGGTALNAKSLVLQPEFFSQGGFADFTLAGLGLAPGSGFAPSVYIAPGTVVEPVADSLVLVPHGGAEGGLSTKVVTKPVGLRSPVSLFFKAPGVSRIGPVVLGEVFMGAGALIKTDPLGEVSFTGDAVALLGSVFAPGGRIDVKGGSSSILSSFFPDATHALTSVYIGPGTTLSTAGTTVLTPDLYGRRTGTVLPGGTITIAGNIVAEKGSVLDVSGTSGILDFHPSAANPLVPYSVPATSGLTSPLYGLIAQPVRVDSSGGGIELHGSEMMFVDSTLRGFAGGPTAAGGTLLVSSGRYYEPNTIPPVLDSNLVVTQGSLPARDRLPTDGSAIGHTVLGVGGTALIARGYFAADSFQNGGFDSLGLDGKVEFKGPVTIRARSAIQVGTKGLLFADSDVHLSAPYVQLGQSMGAPVLPEQRAYPFTNIPPSYGTGRLFVDASLIDLGTLSFQNIGAVVLNARNGDIRGNGIVDIAGTITLRAAQVYPTTLAEFSIFAYDYNPGTGVNAGTIRIEQSGSRNLPLSAAGTLSLYASNIEQYGTLRAPFGTINLGWDGTGTAPKDPITGTSRPVPVTSTLTLGAGSVTSVSGVDPLTGRGIVVPYGTSDGTSWLDPRGFDITGGGLPVKAVNLSAGTVKTLAGSTIDLRGGGELVAVQWVIGNGGQTDLLGQADAGWSATKAYVAGDLVSYHGATYSARTGSTDVQPSISAYWTKVPESYAVIPGYSFNYTPYSPFDSFGDSTLGVGDRIFLGGSPYLAQGSYTLLPSRYALLPGAVLVTPKQGFAMGTVALPGGTSLVSGYQFNDLNGSRTQATLASRYEVAPSNVVHARAEYNVFAADDFLAASAEKLNIATPRLPGDSGYLLFQATTGMLLQGGVLSQSITSGGRGSSIDISAALNFTISNSSSAAPVPGAIVLDAAVLSSFGAESLLIGGSRTRTSTGSTITVTATSLTVDNAGTTLSAPDLILVSKGNLTIEAGSALTSSGSISQADIYTIAGNGTLIRVSQDLNADIIRTGVTPGLTPVLTVRDGASITGGGVVLDSTGGAVLDPGASLNARALALNAGRISLQLDNPGPLQPSPGLVLQGGLLSSLGGGGRLSLLSYSSIDVYGSGTVGGAGLQQLTLNAGQIRGFTQSGGDVNIEADTLILGNKSGVASAGRVAAATGALNLNAGTIRLTANTLAIDQFTNVNFNASSRIIGEGSGGVTVQNAAVLNTPLLTGAAGSIRTFTAGGNLTVASPGGAAGMASGSLGASLSLTGANVSVDTTILLPSGSLSIRSTTGDLTIGGQLNVGGTAQTFYDVTRYTDAGRIQLTSDAGSVRLSADSVIDASAAVGGGNAGTLVVSAANGSLVADGTLLGKEGQGGTNGSFELDTKTLTSTAALSTTLTNASFTQRQSIRVRTGNVVIDGTATAHDFRLSADQGGITVTGTIDASGTTGGSIALASRGDLVLASGSLLTVAAQTFDSAGKGGSVTLESGTQSNGVIGTGNVRLLAGSSIDLSVAAKVAGDAATVGSSAYQGRYSGTLHLRAPQNAAGNDLLVGAIDATIIDASSIVVEGYRLYDLTPGGGNPAAGGTITSAVQTSIFNDAQSFLGASGTTTANYTAMTSRLLAHNAGLGSVFVLAPGAELINRTGDLTLGAVNSDTTADWNLSTFRFGAKGAAGVLTLRAAGNVNLYNALSDGFSPTLGSNDTSWLWLARPTVQNPLLPVNTQSWSYRFTAGADVSAADFHQTGTTVGSLRLGKDGGAMAASGDASALTSSVIGATTVSGGRGLFQVLRTGSGDIDITARDSVQWLNQFASIYTAGTRVSDPTLGGLVDFISLSQTGATTELGAEQQNYQPVFTVAGGNVSINAGANLERLGSSSSRELPNNWLYRRGNVDANGDFGLTGFSSSIASTAWWVDFSNFFEGVGTLGGGNIVMSAKNNITNVEAVAPTNARTSKGTPANPLAANQTTVELGGGDVTVRAGNNIDAGVYYVERGHGILSAGGQITTNASRSAGRFDVSTGVNVAGDPNTWLPATLFLGKGGFDVSAGGNVLLGPVANAFLLPAGLGNSFWNKTYFSTYAADSYVNVSSLGGSITLREGAYIDNNYTPLLAAWVGSQQRLTNTPGTTARSQPWLRLAETDTQPFNASVSLMAPTLRATAYSGDINLAGNITLAPAAKGTLELLTRSAINGLRPVGFDTRLSPNSTAWFASSINVSDANPASLPGVLTPFSYQSYLATKESVAVSLSPGRANKTEAGFLATAVDQWLDETGATLGNDASAQVKQNLHSDGLHSADTSPLRLYTGALDISGITLFSPKPVEVIAGRDISDVAFYVQNLRTDDVSIISSGRDILPYNANSPLRLQSTSTGNTPVIGAGPLAGDLQIGGPGTLQVLAGRNIDLGTNPAGANADGTGAGINSIGNARNPYLSFDGADLVIAAGIGPALSLFDSSLKVDDFINTILSGPLGARYLGELAARDSSLGASGTLTLPELKALDDEARAKAALDLFFLALRDAGRDKNLATGQGGYVNGLSAITALIGGGTFSGDIITRDRDIRTRSGGDISILAPGGGLTLAPTVSRNALIPPGIITEAGGNISIFTDGDVNLGVSRIFTLRGGDIVVWSSTGNIAAGASSKTVQSAPPTRVLVDPSSADVATDLAGLATGGGIGVLATVAGVPPGSVDLIAPLGTVDAGDAGIRATGNLNIAAVTVLNASNISVGGSSAGTPAAPVVSAPNVGSITSASSTAVASTSNATNAAANQRQAGNTEASRQLPSIISVEVLGYGGDDEDEDEKRKKKR